MKLTIDFRLLMFTVLATGALSARAADDCDRLLATPLASFLAETKADRQPSRAFVRLIEYYITKSGDEVSNSNILRTLLDSPGPINPLKRRKEPLAVQISAALDPMLAPMTIADWLVVKDEIRKLDSETARQDSDRGEKRRREERKKFAGELVAEIKTAGGLYSRPAVTQVGSRTYIATTSSGKNLELFALQNGELTHIQSFAQGNGSFSSPAWYDYDGKKYLSLAREYNGVELLELKETGLIKSPKIIKVGQPPISEVTVAPLIKDGRAYFAVTNLTSLRLYEVEGTISQELQVIDLFHDSKAAYKEKKEAVWQVVGDETHLILCNGEEKKLLHFVLENRELKLREAIDINDQVEMRPAWHTHKGRTFLAVTTFAPDLTIYELRNGRLEKIEEIELHNGVRSAVAWHSIGEQIYLAYADFGKDFRIFEVKENSVEVADERSHIANSNDPGEMAWLEHDGRTYLAKVLQGNKIEIFDFTHRALVKIGEFKLSGDSQGGPSWYVHDGAVYIVTPTFRSGATVGSVEGNLSLHRVFGDVQKRDAK